MTKKKEPKCREWNRIVDFQMVCGLLVKAEHYIPPLPEMTIGKPGEESPKPRPLGPRPPDIATLATADEKEAYEAGKRDCTKEGLDRVREMLDEAYRSISTQQARPVHPIRFPTAGWPLPMEDTLA